MKASLRSDKKFDLTHSQENITPGIRQGKQLGLEQECLSAKIKPFHGDAKWAGEDNDDSDDGDDDDGCHEKANSGRIKVTSFISSQSKSIPIPMRAAFNENIKQRDNLNKQYYPVSPRLVVCPNQNVSFVFQKTSNLLSPST